MLNRLFFQLLAVLVVMVPAIGGSQEPAKGATLYSFTPNSIDGTPSPLEQYRGKVLMIVNTASKCGFTPQYEGLEEIYKKYQSQGFEILAFPSNDFMGQEPGSNSEIKSFCKTNYDVTFPLFARGAVTGDDKQPVFKFLTEGNSAELRGEVRWNFEKFIVDRKGNLIERYRSFTSPSSEKVTKRIEALLAEPSVVQ